MSRVLGVPPPSAGSGKAYDPSHLHQILLHHCELGNSTAVCLVLSLPQVYNQPAFWSTLPTQHRLEIAYCLLRAIGGGATESGGGSQGSKPKEGDETDLQPLTAGELYHLLAPIADRLPSESCALLHNWVDKLREVGVAENTGASQVETASSQLEGETAEGSPISPDQLAAVVSVLRSHVEENRVSRRKRQREPEAAGHIYEAAGAEEATDAPASESAGQPASNDNTRKSVAEEFEKVFRGVKPTSSTPQVVSSFDDIPLEIPDRPQEVQRRFRFDAEEDRAIIEGVSRFSGQYRFQQIYSAYSHVWRPGRTIPQIVDHWRTILRNRIVHQQ